MNNFIPKPVIVLGAGGHAKIVAEALVQSKREVLGFVTPDKEPGTEFFGHSVLGDDRVLDMFSPDRVVLANGIGALPGKNLRWRLAGQMREKGYSFMTIVHPSTIIASDVKFGEGVQVMAGSVIHPGTLLGRDSIINTGVLLDHDCQVAENCHLAPGVVCSGGVEIGRNTHLGTGVIVIQNVSIGNNTVVAAGSVVYQNVSDNINFIQTKQLRLTKVR